MKWEFFLEYCLTPALQLQLLQLKIELAKVKMKFYIIYII